MNKNARHIYKIRFRFLVLFAGRLASKLVNSANSLPVILLKSFWVINKFNFDTDKFVEKFFKGSYKLSSSRRKWNEKILANNFSFFCSFSSNWYQHRISLYKNNTSTYCKKFDHRGTFWGHTRKSTSLSNPVLTGELLKTALGYTVLLPNNQICTRYLSN